MTRVIPPQNQTPNSKTPSWLDVSKVLEAVQVEQQLVKKATEQSTVPAENEKQVVTSYGCPRCSKVYQLDNPELQKQANIAERAGQEVKFACPVCGDELAPYGMFRKQASQEEIRHSDESAFAKDLTKEASGTYNTYVDRHMVYKAVNALETYAMKQGMTQARAKYLSSEHTKIAGQQYATLNKIACAIEWRFGKNARKQVYAEISIDAAGNFKLPKTFVTDDKKVIAFEKEEIKAIEHEAEYAPTGYVPNKKTDTPQMKRPDPSRHRAMASEELADQLVKEAANDPNVDMQKAQQAPGTPQLPNDSTTTMKAGDQVFNPADGLTYRLQSVTPGQGATAVNTQNNQTVGIAQNQLPGLVPAVKSTSLVHEAVTPEGFEDVVQSLKEDPEIDNPWAVAWSMKNKGDVPHHGKKSSFEDLADQLVAEALNPNASKTEVIEISALASRRVKPGAERIQTMSKRWNEIRVELLKKEAREPQKDETGHDRVTGLPFTEDRDIVVGLTEFPKDQKRDDSTGLPTSNEKGYRIPFKKMDDNQVSDREHFENEKRLPDYRKRRDESSTYKPEEKHELGLADRDKPALKDDLFEAALRSEVGLTKEAIELATEDSPEMEKKPVEHKPLKKAPGISEYKEPDVIEPASGRVKEALTKAQQVEQTITETTAKLQAQLAPLQKQVMEVSEPLNKELKGQRETLKKYYEMAFMELQQAGHNVAAFKNMIYAAVERQKEVTPPAKLEEVIAKAEAVMPELAAKIAEIVELIESERSKVVLEQTLYEYPVSKVQEPKIKTKTSLEATANALEVFLTAFKATILDLKELNASLESTLAPAKA